MDCNVLFLLSLCCFKSLTFCWDLTSYNISSNYYVSSITVYVNRAFLALPRSSCYNNITNPTLVEVNWYNEQMFFRKSPFFLESQIWDTCDHLQDVISIDMELMRPRLWVLDKGNSNCSPKIVIYNLFQKVNYTLNVPEPEIGKKLNYLLVDADIKLNGARGYVGLDGAPYILAFSLTEFKWWKINFETESLLPISTKFIAFSRKEPILFLTGGDERAIFSLDLTLIRREFTEGEETVSVRFLGEKLGNSSGLVADFKDGLSYYMTRDFALVRWHLRKPPLAENYDVLAQSYDLLPYVSQLYTGPHNGIWALANPGPPTHCPSTPPQLKKRLVRILKYNIFI